MQKDPRSDQRTHVVAHWIGPQAMTLHDLNAIKVKLDTA